MGRLTISRGTILRIMDPLRELSLFGLFNSTVRTPKLVLKTTSSVSSPGSSPGKSISVLIYDRHLSDGTDLRRDLRFNKLTRSSPSVGGLSILARRGMAVVMVRINQDVLAGDRNSGVLSNIDIT